MGKIDKNAFEKMIEKKPDPEFQDFIKRMIGSIHIQFIEIEYIKPDAKHINSELSKAVKQNLKL